MVISDAHKLLFVHVQKTGGSTIDNRFDEVLQDTRHVTGLDRHATLGQILAAEPDLAAYWTVGFVRNPWARMLSWFRMVERFKDRAEKGRRGADAFLKKNQFIKGVADACPDFETFVMKGPEQWARLRTPQIRYLTSKTRRADFIGRQESLEADLRAILARLELPWEPLQSVNVDKRRPDYREVYTDPMRRRVEDLFAKDIAAFDYSF
ncbi:sulfotransferase family 2 domain-containing protein [Nocardioides sp. URHA0032]|uniref:sulfotransferase family 2 domain-containing protein n=1 Tax=Nocardioides sp. URHA0032 TaxID=1380388 RepID=UPI00048F061D|nr:sulfotransferase family 2 domain-containing protein [Nocardioides sp. URHA0032]